MSARRLPRGRAIWWRQLVAERFVVGTVIGTVLLTAFLASLAPRVLDRASTEQLRTTLLDARPEQRNVRIEHDGRIRFGSEETPLGFVRDRGEYYRSDHMPASVQEATSTPRFVIDSPQFRVASFPDDETGPFPTFLVLRHQEQVEDHFELVDGDLPRLREPIPALVGPDCPDDRFDPEGFEPEEEQICAVSELDHFEVAVTAQTASDMMVEAGDALLVRPDAGDLAWGPAWGVVRDLEMVVTVSGIIELTSADEGFWFGDDSLHRPRIIENPDFRIVHARALMLPESYRPLFGAIPLVHSEYTWRYDLDVGAVEQLDLDELRADVARMAPVDAEVVTHVPRLIDEFHDRRALAVRLLSTAVGGLVIVAFAVLATLGLLLRDRQYAVTSLMADRGASRLRLFGLAVRRALAGVVPPVVVAGIVAPSAIDAGAAGDSQRMLVAVAVGAVVVVAWSGTHRSARRFVGAGRRSSAGPRLLRPSTVAELTTFLVAVASVALLRRRGEIDEVAAEQGVDLLLATAPALLGLAIGLLLVRILGPLLGVLARAGARTRGPVVCFGLRRLAGVSRAGRVSVVIVVMAVGVSVFTSVARTSLTVAQANHAWQEVGAEHRITSVIPGTTLLTATIEGFDDGSVRVARGFEAPGTPVLRWPGSPRVRLIALDSAAYRDVLLDAVRLQGRGELVTHLDALTIADDLEGAIPAIVSTRFGGPQKPVIGDALLIDLGDLDPTVSIVAIAERFPGVPAGEPFLVVDRSVLQTLDGAPVIPTTVLLVGEELSSDELARRLDDAAPTTVVASRGDVLATLADEPLTVWTDRVFLAILASTLLFAAITAAGAVALTEADRARDLTYLRTLGLRRSQATVITAIEQVPPLLIAVGVGLMTGLGGAHALAPAVDLAIFADQTDALPMVTDRGAVLLIVAAFAAVLVLALAISILVGRRRSEVHMLRLAHDVERSP